jgi:hypothetical protein
MPPLHEILLLFSSAKKVTKNAAATINFLKINYSFTFFLQQKKVTKKCRRYMKKAKNQ